MHRNTVWLMNWDDRMVKKYGQPLSQKDWCTKLAYSVGEEGNDYPSNHALSIAEEWEKNGECPDNFSE